MSWGIILYLNMIYYVTFPAALYFNTLFQHGFFFFFFNNLGLLVSLHLSCHEFIKNRFQQFRLLSIGSHEVSFSGWSTLALQLNPSPFFFGFLLFLIVFLHKIQEAVSALRVFDMLNTLINSLGKLTLNCLQQCQQHTGLHCRLFQFCHGNICVAFLFEQCPFPWCLQYHLSCRFACMYGQRNNSMFSKRSREHIYSSAPSLFPLCWSCSWVTERWRWPKDWVSILKKMLPSTTCIWPKPFLSFKFNFCQNKWAVKSQEDTCKCSRSPIGNSVGQFCDLLVPKWRYINWWIKPQIKAPAFF